VDIGVGVGIGVDVGVSICVGVGVDIGVDAGVNIGVGVGVGVEIDVGVGVGFSTTRSGFFTKMRYPLIPRTRTPKAIIPMTKLFVNPFWFIEFIDLIKKLLVYLGVILEI
jgi:hypothetical protein